MARSRICQSDTHTHGFMDGLHHAPVAAPLAGGDLLVTDDDYGRYVKAVTALWSWQAAQLHGSIGTFRRPGTRPPRLRAAGLPASGVRGRMMNLGTASRLDFAMARPTLPPEVRQRLRGIGYSNSPTSNSRTRIWLSGSTWALDKHAVERMTSLGITTICSARRPPAPVLSPWRSVAVACMADVRHREEDLEVVTETFSWRAAQSRWADPVMNGKAARSPMTRAASSR